MDGWLVCQLHEKVSILVSVDSVFEETHLLPFVDDMKGFNPSFCGFGI